MQIFKSLLILVFFLSVNVQALQYETDSDEYYDEDYSEEYSDSDEYQNDYSEDYVDEAEYQDNYQDGYSEDYADEEQYQDDYQDDYSEDYEDDSQYQDDYQDDDSEVYEDEAEYQDNYQDDYSEDYEDDSQYQDDYQDDNSEDYEDEEQYQDNYQGDYSEDYEDEGQYQDDNSEYYEDEDQYQNQQYDQNDTDQNNQQLQSSDIFNNQPAEQTQQQTPQPTQQLSQQAQQETQSTHNQNNPNNKTQQTLAGMLNEIKADEANWKDLFKNDQKFDPEKMATLCLTQLGGNNCDVFVLKAMVAYKYTKTGQVNPSQEEWDAVRNVANRAASDCKENCLKAPVQALSGAMKDIQANEETWRNMFKNETSFDAEKMARMCIQQQSSADCGGFVMMAKMAFQYTKTGNFNVKQEELDALKPVIARAGPDCKQNCIKDQMLQQSNENIMAELKQIKNFDPQEQWNNISQRTSGSDFCKLYTFHQMFGRWLNAADENDPTDNRNNKQWVTNWAANIDAFVKQKGKEFSNDPRWQQIQDGLNSGPREQRGEAMRQVLRNECQQGNTPRTQGLKGR